MKPRFAAAAIADSFALEDFFEAHWPGSRARFIADLDDFIGWTISLGGYWPTLVPTLAYHAA